MSVFDYLQTLVLIKVGCFGLQAWWSALQRITLTLEVEQGAGIPVALLLSPWVEMHSPSPIVFAILYDW